MALVLGEYVTAADHVHACERLRGSSRAQSHVGKARGALMHSRDGPLHVCWIGAVLFVKSWTRLDLMRTSAVPFHEHDAVLDLRRTCRVSRAPLMADLGYSDEPLQVEDPAHGSQLEQELGCVRTCYSFPVAKTKKCRVNRVNLHRVTMEPRPKGCAV